MTELRILVIGLSWPPETFLDRLLDGLTGAGFHLEVASSQRPAPQWLAKPNRTWTRLPSWNLPPVARLSGLVAGTLRALGRAPGETKKLARRLGLGQASGSGWHTWCQLAPLVGRSWDAIYFPWITNAIDHLPWLESLGIPVVVSCRGAQINIAPHDPGRAAIREGLRATFRNAAVVHCVSRAICLEAARYGLEPAKACVIRPAVDVEFFRPTGASPPTDGTFRIVTTGSLIWRKGYEYALMTLRALLDMGLPASLDIIGEGSERQQVLFTLQDLNLVQHTTLHGQLPPAAIRDQLHRSHAFFLSSLSEGISNAVLEAMACGLPVVTTDCGGMREAVTDGEDGLVVPVRESAAAAAALARLAHDRALRERLSQAARRTVERRFALPRQIAHYAEMFRSLDPDRPGATTIS